MRVYVQQYGKERTGTNYTKALIGRNFSNVVLFDNRLGSKHDPHIEVRDWMDRAGVNCRAAFDKLLATDHYWRTRNAPNANPFEWVHQPVTWEELLALADGREPLHYVINIKHPYAYIVSLSRWRRHGLHGFEQAPGGLALAPDLVRQECEAYNVAYRSYLPLIESGRGLLGRHEDLLNGAIPFVAAMRDRFGLIPKSGELVDVPEIVAPDLGVTGAPFYRSYYSERRYLSKLSAVLMDAIDSSIDWDLMSRFSYEPERLSASQN